MYKFDPKGEPPETAFRAIALDQLDEVLSDLDKPDEGGRSAVHEARRRTKKLRGLLRLVRPGFADFDKENKALRDAAGLLSHLRDREVQRDTLRALAKWRGSPVLERLLAASASGEAEDNSAALGEFRSRLKDVRVRAEHWALSKPGPETLAAGLRQTYRSARRRMQRAARLKSADTFHDWRKSNKNHGFHLDLLRKSAPDILAHEFTATDRLSTLLGEHHDLFVLTSAIDAGHLPLNGPDEAAELRQLIGARLKELEHDAFELGRQIYAERPKALARRIWSYWKSAS